MYDYFEGWSKGLFECTEGWCLWNILPTSVVAHLRCHSVIVMVSLATLTSAMVVELLPSGNLLAFFAASFASLPASSFPAIELCPCT